MFCLSGKQISNELLDTFDTSFLYSAFKNDPKLIADWGRLNEMLKDFMSDQSDCSYLSRHPVAKFWRKLVDRFPELVDFLAVADEDIRGHFISFITTLYRDFYLTNKVKTLPIFGILNWRDRAPMAQWLAMASKSDREFFTSFMSKLFEAVGMDPISAFDEKVSGCIHVCALFQINGHLLALFNHFTREPGFDIFPTDLCRWQTKLLQHLLPRESWQERKR